MSVQFSERVEEIVEACKQSWLETSDGEADFQRANVAAERQLQAIVDGSTELPQWLTSAANSEGLLLFICSHCNTVHVQQEHGECPEESKYDGFRFINVYLVDRAYGGSEEGGWWFDTGEFIRSYPFKGTDEERDAKQEEIRAELTEQNEDEGRRDISSVLSTGQYQCWTEDHPGADFPTEQPHYE